MASIIYNDFWANLANKLIDWSGDTLKLSLVNNAYSPNKDDVGWSQVISQECSGTGYNAGGTTLLNASVTVDNSNDLVKLDADDQTFSSSSLSAYYGVVREDTVAGSSLICCFDFGADQISSNGNFTIQWNASGLINLKQV